MGDGEKKDMPDAKIGGDHASRRRREDLERLEGSVAKLAESAGT